MISKLITAGILASFFLPALVISRMHVKPSKRTWYRKLDDKTSPKITNYRSQVHFFKCIYKDHIALGVLCVIIVACVINFVIVILLFLIKNREILL